MALSLVSSPIWQKLYGDAELAALFQDSAEIRAMLLVEGALAKAQAGLGLIPPAAAEAIARAAVDAVIDPAALADGTAAAGVPVPALVTAFRAALGDAEAAAFVHYGATSQDIMDTGLILRLRRVVGILDARLAALIARLAEVAQAHRTLPMAARTRGQVATPTTFGARVASWGMPLIRHRARLAELSPRLLALSLAGASGTGAAFGPQWPKLNIAVAEGLGLSPAPVPWHNARDTVVELGNWAALVTGSLGKIGADLMHLGQSELGEVRAGASGGSSTMPHKQNPVGPELLVTLATAAPAALSGLHAALVHQSERDSIAWAQEWQHLPALLLGTGRALDCAAALAADIRTDPTAMARPFGLEHGAMFAEAASFALTPRMPRPEADARVKAALAKARDRNVPLQSVLAAYAPDIDWPSVFDPLTQAGHAPSIADAFCEAAAAQT